MKPGLRRTGEISFSRTKRRKKTKSGGSGWATRNEIKAIVAANPGMTYATARAMYLDDHPPRSRAKHLTKPHGPDASQGEKSWNTRVDRIQRLVQEIDGVSISHRAAHLLALGELQTKSDPQRDMFKYIEKYGVGTAFQNLVAAVVVRESSIVDATERVSQPAQTAAPAEPSSGKRSWETRQKIQAMATAAGMDYLSARAMYLAKQQPDQPRAQAKRSKARVSTPAESTAAVAA